MSLDSTLVYYSCNQDFFFSLVLSRATTDSGGHTKTMARRRRLPATIAKGQPNNFRYFDKKTGNGLVRNFHGQRGDCEKKGKIEQVPPSFLLLLALQNDLAIYQHWQQQLSRNNVVPCKVPQRHHEAMCNLSPSFFYTQWRTFVTFDFSFFLGLPCLDVVVAALAH